MRVRIGLEGLEVLGDALASLGMHGGDPEWLRVLGHLVVFGRAQRGSEGVQGIRSDSERYGGARSDRQLFV